MLINDANGNTVVDVRTNADGSYRTGRGLRPGTYFARTSETPEGLDEVYNNILCAGCDSRSGTPIAVTAGADTPNIDFDLAGGGRVSGLVSDTGTGLPIALAGVRLISAAGDVVAAVTTDLNGRYRSTPLPPGVYTATAAAAGHVRKVHSNLTCLVCSPNAVGTAITVSDGTTTANIDFALDRGGSITGRVTDASSGLGVSASVAVYQGSTSIDSVDTDFTGHYRFDGLPTGSYLVVTESADEHINVLYPATPCTLVCDFATGTPVTVTAPGVTGNIDFVLERGGGVTGFVRDTAGRPLAEVEVDIFTANDVFVESGNTDDSGRYVTTRSLPAGQYYAIAAGENGYLDALYAGFPCAQCRASLGTPIIVTAAGLTSGIDFTLRRGGRIAGVIRSAESNAGLRDVTVKILNAAGLQVTSGVSSSQGTYLTGDLLPGTYFAKTSNSSGYVDTFVGGATFASATPIVVTSGATTAGVDAALAAGGRVSGIVYNSATGQGIGDVTISFGAPGGGVLATSPPTEFDGSFVIGLPPGVYVPRVNLAGGFTTPATPGAAITVTAGGTTSGVNFALTACGAGQIAPLTLPPTTIGVPYGAQLTGSGGTPPYTFSMASGQLPAGLTLGASGIVIGAATVSGSAEFTAAMIDGASCPATRTYTFVTCSIRLQTTSASFLVGGGNGSVVVVPSGECPWIATTEASWITIANGSGTGRGTLSFTVAPNPMPNVFRTGIISVGGQTYTVTQASFFSAPPFGTVDTPLEGATNLRGLVAVTGWALDDLGVANVRIYRNSVAPEPPGGLVFIGDAVRVEGARPDVQATYAGLPFSSRAGWGYLMLTNFLPGGGNGTFTLSVVAEDIEGRTTLLGSRTITVDNNSATAPFGTIDTPAQGAVVSGGTYVAFGWALTPLPKTIPFDGSTIQVFIDGAPIGTASYNHARADLVALFPGLNNSNGSVGYRLIDTTALADGVHTIAWQVVDDAGVVEGIGSRFFTVANDPGASAVTAPAERDWNPGGRAGTRRVAGAPVEPATLSRDRQPPARPHRSTAYRRRVPPRRPSGRRRRTTTVAVWRPGEGRRLLLAAGCGIRRHLRLRVHERVHAGRNDLTASDPGRRTVKGRSGRSRRRCRQERTCECAIRRGPPRRQASTCRRSAPPSLRRATSRRTDPRPSARGGRGRSNARTSPRAAWCCCWTRHPRRSRRRPGAPDRSRRSGAAWSGGRRYR